MRSPADLLLLIRCKTIRPDQQIEGLYQAMQHPKRHRSCLSQPQAAHPHHHQTICRYHHSLFRLNKYNYVLLCQEPYHLNIPKRASLFLPHPNAPKPSNSPFGPMYARQLFKQPTYVKQDITDDSWEEMFWSFKAMVSDLYKESYEYLGQSHDPEEKGFF